MNNKLQKIFGYINLVSLIFSLVSCFLVLLVFYVIGGISSGFNGGEMDIQFVLLLIATLLTMVLILVNIGFTITLKVLSRNDDNFTTKKIGTSILITNVVLNILTIIASSMVVAVLIDNIIYVIALIISIIAMIVYTTTTIVSFVRVRKDYSKSIMQKNVAKANSDLKINLDNFNQ